MAYGRDYLGPYRLIRMVRAGNSCQIWEATNDSDGRRVALKSLQPNQKNNKEELGYLKHEFDVGRTLKHPNLIEIYEYNDEAATPYLVMEIVKAENMKQMMRSNPDLLAFHSPGILKQCTEALKYLHEKGWVHRDVKPDNFLVDTEANVKLLDFAISQKPKKGLGRLFAGKSKIQGTRSYMSPEQIRGEPLDFRADIYSFGCLTYELLTGKTPYSAANPDDLLGKHLRAPIPTVVSANPNITQACADLITSMLAKKKEYRIGSMDDILQELTKLRIFRNHPKPPAEPQEPTEP